MLAWFLVLFRRDPLAAILIGILGVIVVAGGTFVGVLAVRLGVAERQLAERRATSVQTLTPAELRALLRDELAGREPAIVEQVLRGVRSELRLLPPRPGDTPGTRRGERTTTAPDEPKAGPGPRPPAPPGKTPPKPPGGATTSPPPGIDPDRLGPPRSELTPMIDPADLDRITREASEQISLALRCAVFAGEVIELYRAPSGTLLTPHVCVARIRDEFQIVQAPPPPPPLSRWKLALGTPAEALQTSAQRRAWEPLLESGLGLAYELLRSPKGELSLDAVGLARLRPLLSGAVGAGLTYNLDERTGIGPAALYDVRLRAWQPWLYLTHRF